MTTIAKLTGSDNYFENFEVGTVYEHARGKTMSALENVLITNMVLNTAQGHFNVDRMKKSEMAFGNGQIVAFGGVNFSLILGLASQDCCENALAELKLDNIRLMRPVTHGDTLYAYSEVLEKRDAEQEDAGIVVFRHYGVNQNQEQVVQVDRTVLSKRRSHWADR